MKHEKALVPKSFEIKTAKRIFGSKISTFKPSIWPNYDKFPWNRGYPFQKDTSWGELSVRSL